MVLSLVSGKLVSSNISTPPQQFGNALPRCLKREWLRSLLWCDMLREGHKWPLRVASRLPSCRYFIVIIVVMI